MSKIRGEGPVWLVGELVFLVQTILHPIEKQLAWTNTALEKAR